ncbi:MAG TPA: response regulator transcription factor [Bacteroidetes bacterium]|nr:response regulator transcription factor [Bacteroidota bacterium]
MDTKQYKILLVDDEEDILEFLSYNFKKEGYQVYTSDNGKNAIEKAKNIHPDLIVLDVMMPEMDGIECCMEMRKIPSLQNTLIIFLTARAEDYSHIAGFEAGADDYIAKPIKPRLLISKVKALLRRLNVQQTEEKEKKQSLGDLVIDRERFVVYLKDKEISLPKKEFELLSLLISKPNKVFSREEIFAKIWGNDVIVGDRTIDVHIRKIREKLNINNIQTVKGVGYKYSY